METQGFAQSFRCLQVFLQPGKTSVHPHLFQQQIGKVCELPLPLLCLYLRRKVSKSSTVSPLDPMKLPAFFLCISLASAFADAPVPNGRRLKEIVADKYPEGNVWIGCAITGSARAKGGVEEQILRREFSYVTPENEFKHSAIQASPGKLDWSGADQWLDYARKQGQALRMHGPIGPQTSKWTLEDNRTAEELAPVLEQFLTALCERYQADPAIRWMDVVNETVDEKGVWFGPKPGTGSWENPWTLLGFDTDVNKTPLYISRAFAIATKHAPRLKLIYNHHTNLDPAGMEKVKETVVYLRAKGLRVDGIGWHAHLKPGWEKESGNLDYLSKLIAWCHQNALEFHITENNMRLWKFNEANENEASADTFAALVRTLLQHRKTGVVGWNCWRATDYVNKQGRVGLLFAEDGSPKPAYYAVQNLLENPPEALP